MAKRSKNTLRSRQEIEEALEKLEPLQGDLVVDAVMGSLRWVLRQGEWKEIWTELEEKHTTVERATDE